MKLSEYVVKYLESVTDSIFLLSGGGIMHLVDSLGRSKKIYPVCCHHEQAAGTAAEGYARIKNDIGVCLVTTGPGGTNVITSIASAWLDSIPMFVLSGQVKTANITPRKNGALTVRQIGLQELNVIDLIRPITKYAVTVYDKDEIKYHLDKAIYLAKTGRPGPVWIDIPLDIQAAEIDVKNLKSFTPPPASLFPKPKIPTELIVNELKKAKRPLMMVGNGIRLAHGEKVLAQVLKKFKLNAVTALFTADDLVTEDYSYYLGRQGTSGTPTANWAIDNCDLLLVVGERVQLTQTSFDYHKFAENAVKIMVDIDENELHKETLNIDIPVCCDAKIFLEELFKQDIKLNRWEVKVKKFKAEEFHQNKKYLNVFAFLEKLGKLSEKYPVVTTNGMAAVATHQGLRIANGQRFIVNAGLGQMGMGLPLAIGSCLASHKKPVICMEGDGSIMLNIQDLQTIVHHKLPIKIFIYNNNAYFSIRNTHKNFFNKVFAADPDSGVSLPDFEKIIPAWGLAYERISNNKELSKLEGVMRYKGPIVCELMLDPAQPLYPRWSAGQYT